MEQEEKAPDLFIITSISHGGVLSNNSYGELVLSDWFEKVTSSNTWAIERTMKKIQQHQQNQPAPDQGYGMAAVGNFFGWGQQSQQPQQAAKRNKAAAKPEPGNLILHRGTYSLVFDMQGNLPALIHSPDDSCAQWRFVLTPDKKANYIYHSESHLYLRCNSQVRREQGGPNQYGVTLEELNDKTDPRFLWKVTNSIEATQQASDNANWMRNMRAVLNAKRLNELVLPGTQNSGTFGVRDDSGFSGDQPWLADYIGRAGGYLARSAVLPWARTQEMSILRQLKDGIRYFDFRVALGVDQEERTELYLSHFMNGQKVSEAILELLNFLETKNDEIIIVNLNAFYGMSQSDHQDLANQIVTFLDDYLVPREVKASITYHQLINVVKRQLIVIYQDDFISKSYPQFWTQYSIASPWPQTTVPEELREKLKSNLNVRSTDRFFVSQAVLTPDSTYIFASWLPYYAKNRREISALAHLVLSSWLSDGSAERRESLNIIATDFYNDSNLVYLAKHLNEWSSFYTEHMNNPMPIQIERPPQPQYDSRGQHHEHQQGRAASNQMGDHGPNPQRKKKKKRQNADDDSFSSFLGRTVVESMTGGEGFLANAMLGNTDNAYVKSMAKDKRVQEHVSKSMNNEKVHRMVGDAMIGAASNPEVQRKAKDATKSLFSMGVDMAMGSAKQSFNSKI